MGSDACVYNMTAERGFCLRSAPRQLTQDDDGANGGQAADYNSPRSTRHNVS